jgi:hypothetical protein
MSRIRVFTRTFAGVLILSAGFALPVAAQSVGAIAGTVVDSSGAVLPGVNVTLSAAEGTVGANQQGVTDERGTYQFLRLVSGTYTVKAELQGFRPAEQRNIIVNADVTSRADLKLEIGNIEEGVTVSGEAPLLDTTSALKQTVLSHEVLNSLPNRFDLWSMARVIPSVVMSRVDVGGSAAFVQSGPTVHGTSTENGYFIDGMDVGQLDSNGAGTIFFADPYAFQEVNLQTGGAGVATAARGGLVYNMITRTGTNQLHGEILGSGSLRSWVSDNLSPELEAQLLATVPPVALQANPNINLNADILRNVDYGAWVSGPIKEDKLWFSFSYHNKMLDQYIVGNYNADGTNVADDNSVWTTSSKIAWQVTKTAQWAYTNNLQHRIVGHRNDSGGTFADSAARNINDKYPNAHQTKFTTPWRSSMVVDLSYNRFRAEDRFRPTAEVLKGAISKQESTSNTVIDATPTYKTKPQYREQVQASLSWFRGKHDMLFGYNYVLGGARERAFATSGMRAVYTNGIPTSVNTYNVPIAQSLDEVEAFRYEAWDRLQNFYFQDKWTPTRKLTLNIGLRVSDDYGWMPATCLEATIFVQGQCFGAINAMPDYTSFTPRISAVYDVMGDGKTALKFGANRYNVPIVLSYIQRLNPTGIASDSRVWTVCAAGQTAGCDLNGDRLPQFNELGASTGFSSGAATRYSPNLKPPLADEYVAEIQRQLPRNVVATVGYTYRKKFNQVGVRNVAVPTETYIPLTVTEVVSGQTVTVYNQAPSLRGRIDNVWDSDPSQDSVYQGADINFSKRMSAGWSLMGGASFGRTTGDPVGGDLNNPNNQQYRKGIVGNDVPWSYRLSGVYELPYGVAASGTASYYAGFAETTTVVVNSRTVALTQSSQTIWLEERGNTRLPNVFQLDLAFRKTMRFGGYTFEPRLDAYNVTNNAAVLGRVQQLGPSFGRASTIMNGRLVKIGANFMF